MKNKFKFLGLVLVVLTICGFTNAVKADGEPWKTCGHHKNYYFFNNIQGSEYYEKRISKDGQRLGDNKESGTDWTHSDSTTLPSIGDAGQDISIEKAERVCLYKQSASECDGYSGEKMLLETFYSKYRGTAFSGNILEYKNNGGNTDYSGYMVEGDTTYFTHGRVVEAYVNFFGGTSEDNHTLCVVHAYNPERYGPDEVCSYYNDDKKLVSGSILPTEESMSSNPISDFNKNRSYFEITVNRKIAVDTYGADSVVYIPMRWPDYAEDGKGILVPAMYYVEYDVNCEDDTTYKATIDYFYEGTTERVEFPDGSKNPWTGTNLDDGYSRTVNSPSLSGCVPDKKSVNVQINGKDFYDKVYYTCTVQSNPKTGDMYIGIIAVFAVAGLVYAYWYFSRGKNRKNDTNKKDTKKDVKPKDEK